jgi:anti-anti-sigma regulatory factor
MRFGSIPRVSGAGSVVIEYRPAEYPSIDSAVGAALGAGSGVTLDLDPLPKLDQHGVRGLIKILRRAREVGRPVVLRTGSQEHRNTLSALALDLIFPIEDIAA